jgi:hypothetical protein
LYVLYFIFVIRTTNDGLLQTVSSFFKLFFCAKTSYISVTVAKFYIFQKDPANIKNIIYAIAMPTVHTIKIFFKNIKPIAKA